MGAMSGDIKAATSEATMGGSSPCESVQEVFSPWEVGKVHKGALEVESTLGGVRRRSEEEVEPLRLQQPRGRPRMDCSLLLAAGLLQWVEAPKPSRFPNCHMTGHNVLEK